MKTNSIKFNAKNKKVNITIRGNDKKSDIGYRDIEIETFVREQFFFDHFLREYNSHNQMLFDNTQDQNHNYYIYLD